MDNKTTLVKEAIHTLATQPLPSGPQEQKILSSSITMVICSAEIKEIVALFSASYDAKGDNVFPQPSPYEPQDRGWFQQRSGHIQLPITNIYLYYQSPPVLTTAIARELLLILISYIRKRKEKWHIFSQLYLDKIVCHKVLTTSYLADAIKKIDHLANQNEYSELALQQYERILSIAQSIRRSDHLTATHGNDEDSFKNMLDTLIAKIRIYRKQVEKNKKSEQLSKAVKKLQSEIQLICENYQKSLLLISSGDNIPPDFFQKETVQLAFSKSNSYEDFISFRKKNLYLSIIDTREKFYFVKTHVMHIELDQIHQSYPSIYQRNLSPPLIKEEREKFSEKKAELLNSHLLVKWAVLEKPSSDSTTACDKQKILNHDMFIKQINQLLPIGGSLYGLPYQVQYLIKIIEHSGNLSSLFAKKEIQYQMLLINSILQDLDHQWSLLESIRNKLKISFQSEIHKKQSAKQWHNNCEEAVIHMDNAGHSILKALQHRNEILKCTERDETEKVLYETQQTLLLACYSLEDLYQQYRGTIFTESKETKKENIPDKIERKNLEAIPSLQFFPSTKKIQAPEVQADGKEKTHPKNQTTVFDLRTNPFQLCKEEFRLFKIWLSQISSLKNKFQFAQFFFDTLLSYQLTDETYLSNISNFQESRRFGEKLDIVEEILFVLWDNFSGLYNHLTNQSFKKNLRHLCEMMHLLRENNWVDYSIQVNEAHKICKILNKRLCEIVSLLNDIGVLDDEIKTKKPESKIPDFSRLLNEAIQVCYHHLLTHPTNEKNSQQNTVIKILLQHMQSFSTLKILAKPQPMQGKIEYLLSGEKMIELSNSQDKTPWLLFIRTEIKPRLYRMGLVNSNYFFVNERRELIYSMISLSTHMIVREKINQLDEKNSIPLSIENKIRENVSYIFNFQVDDWNEIIINKAEGVREKKPLFQRRHLIKRLFGISIIIEEGQYHYLPLKPNPGMFKLIHCLNEITKLDEDILQIGSKTNKKLSAKKREKYNQVEALIQLKIKYFQQQLEREEKQNKLSEQESNSSLETPLSPIIGFH